jgi:glycosyltransferase involved in cell wall biosynthesis
MATSKTKTAKQPLLNIVVPVYNEGDNFERLYKEVQKKITVPKRLIVVYDFDEDNTLPVARNIAKKDSSVELVKNTIGRGALNAIKTGFDHVKEGPVLVTMADLADDLKTVDAMYACYVDGAHLVCGSRYMKGGKQVGGPLVKRTMSRIAGVSLRYMRGFPTIKPCSKRSKLKAPAALKLPWKSPSRPIGTAQRSKSYRVPGTTARPVPPTSNYGNGCLRT